MRSHLGKWKMLMVGCQACELIVTREHAGMMFLGYDYLVGCQACTLIKPRVRDLEENIQMDSTSSYRTSP